MTSRFKLAAALGLALATGVAGVASAQTGTAPLSSSTAQTAPVEATPAKTAQKAPAKTAVVKMPRHKASMKKASMKSHRSRVSHRMLKQGKVARGPSTHAKVAHATTLSRPKTARSSLVRKHVAKVKSLYTRHAMVRAAKPTTIR